MFRDLLNFTIKCTEGQIKALSFLFCATSDVKNTTGRVLINRVIVKQ